jgi:hypothetical protein
MTDADHALVVKLALQVKMPRFMYDTPSAREALNRFVQAASLAVVSTSTASKGK